MKNRKLFVISLFIIGLLLLPINYYAHGEQEEGYIIVGDSVIWETDMLKLEVYPHTAYNIIRQTQYANLTWKKSDNHIDVAFRFNDSLTYTDIWKWENISHDVRLPDYDYINANYTLYNINDYIIINNPDYVDYGDIPSLYYINLSFFNNTWVLCGFDTYKEHNDNSALFNFSYLDLTGYHIEQQYWFDWNNKKDKFHYMVYKNKHYYYIKNVFVEQNKTYKFKWEYDIPINTKGKWELLGKLSSDTIQEALDNDRYVMIDPWYNSSYQNFRTITINHNMINTPLVEFPLLVVLDNSTGDYNFHSNGNDIIFVNNANTTQFNHEIELFDNTGKTFCHVNISEQISNISNFTFNVYYNCTTASNSQNMEGTWNNDYLGIYHMNDSTTSTIIDSTTQRPDGDKRSANNPLEVTGKIGKAQDFEEDNLDYIDTNYDFEWNSTSDGNNTQTWEVWIKSEQLPIGAGSWDDYIGSTYQSLNGEHIILCIRKVDGYVFPYLFVDDDTTMLYTRENYGEDLIFVDSWHYIAFSFNDFDNENISLYLNGTFISGTTDNNFENYNPQRDMFIGRQASASARAFDGIIDEFRISKVARNESWILASFHSQNQTTNFIIIGEEVTWINTPPNIRWQLTPSQFTSGHLYLIWEHALINCTDLSDFLDESGAVIYLFNTTTGNLDKTYNPSLPDIFNDFFDVRYENWIGGHIGSSDLPYNNTYIYLNPIIGVYARDYDNDTMTVIFYSNLSGTWQIIETFNNIVNNTFVECYSVRGMHNYNTTYWLRVNVSDGINNTISTVNFTTMKNPSLTQEQTDDLYLSALFDIEVDLLFLLICLIIWFKLVMEYFKNWHITKYAVIVALMQLGFMMPLVLQLGIFAFNYPLGYIMVFVIMVISIYIVANAYFTREK